VLVALPMDLTSLKSNAYRSLAKAGGPAGRNCDGDVSANGVVWASCGKAAGRKLGGVGRHSPGAVSPVNGGDTVPKPSLLRHRRISSATVCPHSMPRAIDSLSAVRNVFVVAHGGERCRPREIEGGLLRRKERNEGDVSGLDRCRASRGASWRLKVDVIRGISPLDPVHGVEDGRVHDREDPSRGRGGCPRRPDRVPSVFIPLGHHIAGRRQWRREAQHGERDRHENTVEEVEVKASMAHDVSPFRLTEYANAVTLGVRAGEGNPGLVSREPPESPSVSR